MGGGVPLTNRFTRTDPEHPLPERNPESAPRRPNLTERQLVVLMFALAARGPAGDLPVEGVRREIRRRGEGVR